MEWDFTNRTSSINFHGLHYAFTERSRDTIKILTRLGKKKHEREGLCSYLQNTWLHDSEAAKLNRLELQLKQKLNPFTNLQSKNKKPIPNTQATQRDTIFESKPRKLNKNVE